MFDDDTFDQWCQHLNLSESTREIIRQIRSSDPARRVGRRAGNVSGRYPSRKMRRTIQFESHRNELAAIHEYEHDETIHEFYDQPPPVKLDYLTKNGRPIAVWHTADFFVIGKDG